MQIGFSHFRMCYPLVVVKGQQILDPLRLWRYSGTSMLVVYLRTKNVQLMSRSLLEPEDIRY
jgi:hypothetical protein